MILLATVVSKLFVRIKKPFAFDRIKMKTEDLNAITAMSRFGGGFASTLAQAFLRADDDNFQRLKNAFPEMWEMYSEIGKSEKDQDFS